MEISDWWLKSLIELLFKKFFVTNMLNIVFLALLAICFIYIIVTSIWFYRSMRSRYTPEQERQRKKLTMDIEQKESRVYELYAIIADKNVEIENWKATIANLGSPLPEKPPAIIPFSQSPPQPQPMEHCLGKMNTATADIQSSKNEILQCQEFIEKSEKELLAIQKSEVKHEVFVNAQTNHVVKANAVIKFSGLMMVIGTICQLIFFEDISLAFTQAAGIAFMVIYGLSFNLEELTKHLQKVVLLGAHQFAPIVNHPVPNLPPNSNPLPNIKSIPKPLPSLKPVPEKTVDEKIKDSTSEIKEARRKRGVLPTPSMMETPDGVDVRVDYPVIDEKTYLQVVSSTQKIFANIKMNGVRFIIMASIHVIIALLFDIDQYVRIFDVVIVFVLAQFTSLWIFKKYVRIDSFTGRFSNAFSVFLYKEFEKAFLLHGIPVTSIDKFKIAKHLLQYLQFVIGMQLKVRIENPAEVLRHIISKFFDKSTAGGFAIFVSCLPERDSINMMRLLPIHPSRSRYSVADMLKIIAAIFSAVYGLLQIIKLLGTP